MKNLKNKVMALLLSATMLSGVVASAAYTDVNANIGNVQDFEALTLALEKAQTVAEPDYGNVLSMTGDYYWLPIGEELSSGQHIISFDMKTDNTDENTSALDIFLQGSGLDTDGTTSKGQWLGLWVGGKGLRANEFGYMNGNAGNYMLFNSADAPAFRAGEWAHIDLLFDLDADADGKKYMYVYSSAGGSTMQTIYQNVAASAESDPIEQGMKTLKQLGFGGRNGGIKLDNIAYTAVDADKVTTHGNIERIKGGKLALDYRIGLRSDFAENGTISLTRTPIGGGDAENVAVEVESVVGSKVVVKPDAEMFAPGYTYSVATIYGNSGGSGTNCGRAVVFPEYTYPTQGAVQPAIFQNFEGFTVGSLTNGYGDGSPVNNDENSYMGNYTNMPSGKGYRVDNNIGVDSGDYILSFDYNPGLTGTSDPRLVLYVQTNSLDNPEKWTQYDLFMLYAEGMTTNKVLKPTFAETKHDETWMIQCWKDFWYMTKTWQHMDIVFHLNPDTDGNKWMEIFSSSGQSKKFKISNSADTTGVDINGIKSFTFLAANGFAVGLDNVYFGPYTDVDTITGSAEINEEGNFVVNYYANPRTTSTTENVFHIKDENGNDVPNEVVSINGSQMTIAPTNPLAGGTYTIVPKVELGGTEYDAVTQCGASVDFPVITYVDAVSLKIVDADGTAAVCENDVYPSSVAGFDITLQNGLENNTVVADTITITDEDEGISITDYTATYDATTKTIKIRFNSLLGAGKYISLAVSGLKDANGTAYDKTIYEEIATSSDAVQTIKQPTIAKTATAVTATVPCINTGDSAMTGVVIVAGYTGNALTAVKIGDLNVASMDKNVNKTFTLETDTTKLTKTAVFVWDGIGTMKPIAAPTVQ